MYFVSMFLMPLKKEYKFYILGGKKMKIAIAGTGYVGLVTGVCLAEVGNENVVCVDVDEQKVKSMKLGIAPIYEEGLEELMVKNYNRG
ncbi:UDP-glucose 6-dehydrogenase, partial [Clostridioides difficile]